MNSRYNFAAGPAMLPAALIEEVKEEGLEQLFVLEMGHRSSAFKKILEEAEALFRKLLHIPQEYVVLFLGVPARSQFSMIPLNLLEKKAQGAYLVSGTWSLLALQEAKKLQKGYSLASCESMHFSNVPTEDSYNWKKNTAYVYYTPNETIQGVRFPAPPQVRGCPLIADMTSCLLTEPLSLEDFSLFFAGAQKNIANAGLTLVVIRKDLIKEHPLLPTFWDYQTHAKHGSLYATPPTLNCYIALKMFQWIEKQGGVRALYQENCHKSALLYNYIDASSFYTCSVAKDARSIVNVCFTMKNKDLLPLFLQESHENGLIGLQGHQSAGGLRASMYNAMPLAGVQKLIAFMEYFQKEYAS